MPDDRKKKAPAFARGGLFRFKLRQLDLPCAGAACIARRDKPYDGAGRDCNTAQLVRIEESRHSVVTLDVPISLLCTLEFHSTPFQEHLGSTGHELPPNALFAAW